MVGWPCTARRPRWSPPLLATMTLSRVSGTRSSEDTLGGLSLRHACVRPTKTGGDRSTRVFEPATAASEDPCRRSTGCSASTDTPACRVRRWASSSTLVRNQHGTEHRAGLHLQPLVLQQVIDRLERLGGELVPRQQEAQPQDCQLVRRPVGPAANPAKSRSSGTSCSASCIAGSMKLNHCCMK